MAPSILVGHSLGAAAVFAAAADIPEAKAVMSIGAPADVSHVLGQFGGSLREIREKGAAQVTLAGRSFTITRSFVEDAEGQRLHDRIGKLGKALLVMHAPLDAIVGIDNATRIFLAAKHPKSFVSLDDADHLLSDANAATYAARVIAAWASKYVPDAPPAPLERVGVLVRETGQGKYQNAIVAGRHRLIADEPIGVGGLDSGPNPTTTSPLRSGACTAMTLRIYAEHKKLALGRVSVAVRHGKVTAQHCSDCGAVAEGQEGRVDRFERTITVEGHVDAGLKDKLVEIAGKCPVHRTLEAASAVVTTVTANAVTEQQFSQKPLSSPCTQRNNARRA
ncbi:MAG: OsmC family protein [Hyphomonadaceae bacterium]|nr:OsmC family protein [Hyphomonadaceae bacterium]